FDTWIDDLQLYLLSDIKDGVSLFDHVSGAATAPPTTADGVTCSQWLTRDAAARLAICNHLPLAECAHFGQHRTAQALYDAVVARYSSPATAALGRLVLPYLFPELSAFSTVEDLVFHLRASDARYCATVPAEFLDKNQPPMFITLYFIVTRLPDSLRSVRDHFLSLDPTSLTFDLLEQHLLATKTSVVAVGVGRGTPRPPFFEGCSPSPLAPSYASATAADVSIAEDVGAASASAKLRCGKGKGGKGGGGGSRGGGGGSGGGGGGSGSSGGGSNGGGGTGGGSGGSRGGGGGSGGSGGGGKSGTGGGGTGAWRVGSGGGQRQQQQCRNETQSPQELREWFLRGVSGGSCPYVIRTGDRAGQTCGRLHTQHCCFSRLDDAWRAEFGDDFKLPHWADLISAEGDYYRCVPPDLGIAATALGATALVFRVWGSRAFVRDLSAEKLSPRAIPCVFLGFVPGPPSWRFYHRTSRRVFPSEDVTFDKSVPFYRLFPYRSAPPLPPPLFLAPGPPPVDPLPPQGPAPSGVSQVDPLPGPASVHVAVGSGAARGAVSGGAGPGGEGHGGGGSEGAETGGAEPGGGCESGGAEPQGAASSGGSAGASPRLSPQQLREWFVRRARLHAGASAAGGAAGAGVHGGTAVTGPGGARTRGTGAAGTSGVEGAGAGDPTESGATGVGSSGAGGAGAGGAGVGGTGAGGAGVLVLEVLELEVLGTPSSTSLTPPLLCPPPDQSQPQLQPASPLPAPSPYTEQSGGLTEHREPASRPVSFVPTAHRVPRMRPPPYPGTHAMTLRPSSVPLHVPLPALPESSLPEVPDSESDRARAASPTVSYLLATAVTDPSF
ncbi:unnamed protein product, partial [Closterium sp. NIES-54]